jgi:hypothetical protein
MPRYDEQFRRPLNADPGTRDVVESPTRRSSTKISGLHSSAASRLSSYRCSRACIADRWNGWTC